ncbi:MAG: Gldg family protein [Sedimentisphaerales bacterium]|nr:Gldg family protein [Sedimentisphaerales bacterium]
MNRTIKAVIAVILIAIICFCAISISQDLLGNLKLDVTNKKLYSLSEGSKEILNRLNQPIEIKLYYTKTAAMKAPDQIRVLNNYYEYIKSLLKEYQTQSNGMVKLEIIDPRPFSDDEIDAIRYGLTRIPISEQESFIFGLVVKTQFGTTKNIPFFNLERQNFVEYDISSLIDTATRRQKKNIGVISSLPVMGDSLSPYMARMMQMQNRQPQGPWIIVQQLREKYEVKKIETDTAKIEGIDILLVIHPKDLPEKTLFAIDQFVVNGGSTIVCVDPYCYSDQPQNQMQMMQTGYKSSSNLEPLMKKWGLKMLALTIAGDRNLARDARMTQKVIGFMDLNKKDCFNKDNVITSELNIVTVLFAGALETIDVPKNNDITLQRDPLICTTDRGNTITVDNPFELMMLNPAELMNKFFEGTKPVRMGYLVTGKFESAYPDGIEIKDESDPNSEPTKLTGLAQAQQECAVAVLSDVDFITDSFAYDETFFGIITVNDNAALLINTVEQLTGSADLISIRSRGNYSRSFEVVDEIEAQAARSTAQKEQQINADITRFRQELNQILATAKEGQEEIISSSILEKKRELESKIIEKQKELFEVKRQARQGIESLESKLRNFNTLPGPTLILLIAIILGIYRATKKRHYVSHSSDA